MKYFVILLFSIVGIFIGLYAGSPSFRSEIKEFDIHEQKIDGTSWYFVWHKGIIETVYTQKSAAIQYVNKHK